MADNEPFPLIVPDGCVYSPAIEPSQETFSEITHLPLPGVFHHIPPIAFEHFSAEPNITKDSVLTSHIPSQTTDFMILWNGFINEFPTNIYPGQTFQACALFVETYKPLIVRFELAQHLLVLSQVNRLSSLEVMQLLAFYDGEYKIKTKFFPESYVAFMNEYHMKRCTKK